MTKKYKLLKDIQQPNDHNYKAGEVFTKIKDDKDSAYLSADKKRAFHPDVIESKPEWFEEMKEKTQVLVHEIVNAKREICGYSFYVYKTNFDCRKIKAAIEEIINPPKGLTNEQIGELIKGMQNQPIEFLKKGKEFTKEDLQEAFNKSRLTHPMLGFVYKDFTEYYDLLPLITKASKQKYKILMWRIFNGELHPKETVAPCKIHSVLRLTDNTEWAVGEKTQHGIINKIEEGDDTPLIFYVGERNYPLFIYEAKKYKK